MGNLFMIFRKKFLLLFFILGSFFYKVAHSQDSINQSFLNDLKICLENKISYKCKSMISRIEKFQLNEYSKGNLKCQTSLLGIQSELIRKIYFLKNKTLSSSKTIPYLIKNC